MSSYYTTKGRTGREVPTEIYIYPKNTTARIMLESEEEEFNKHWLRHHTSLCKCYTPAGETYIAEYSGKFGTGYILFDHFNSNYSYITYCVDKRDELDSLDF